MDFSFRESNEDECRFLFDPNDAHNLSHSDAVIDRIDGHHITRSS